MNPTWRLLSTGQHNAAMNMAIDEAMLLNQESHPQPTLRFYDWSQPTFSFGYFQRITDEVDVDACTSRGIELVRRMTGGGTVIHGWDVTYAIIVPHGSGVLPGSISASYGVISKCLINGFQGIGVDAKSQIKKPTQNNRHDELSSDVLPNICLTNLARYDIMLDGKKIAGVSQRRKQIGVMHQGYIALDMPPPDILEIVSKHSNFDQLVGGKSTAINIGECTPIHRGQIESAVAAGLEKILGIQLVAGVLSVEEMESANRLAQTKYTAAEWNFC